jgi:hypothetical protein
MLNLRFKEPGGVCSEVEWILGSPSNESPAA